MTRTLTLSLLVLTACGRGGDQAQEIDALKRRVTSLERRLSELDAGGKKPAKADEGEEPKRPEGGGHGEDSALKAVVSYEGDAVSVELMRGKRKFSLPTSVVPGEYTVHAVFAEGEEPAEAGTIDLKAGSRVVLACSAGSRACAPK
ncbi:MAG TPA: hypothetical protein PKA64_14175 [Myxococcota bacterium]|nr:hypothetical protein [Myxococcota bacterium]